MSNDFFKISKGVTLKPQASTPSNPQNGDIYYDSTLSRFRKYQNGSWGDFGGAGGGSGKNYLSSIVTSQSSTPNPGNGDFEFGSISGWSLGTIGTLTNGLPTGSPTFGSGASGNLSISPVSSGHLAGSYSLSYASSAATTQGNMLASDTFNIDSEDQAKVLTWKFYYKAQTNPSNANWSGTSSNSFGVAVYDVTNSAWLPVAGQFSMTQNSGIGISVGTFQTASNTTQLRFVVYNVNATSGAATLYFDDFSVGPQTAPIGAVATDWQAFTPTGTWTTNTTYTGYWRRIGDVAEYNILISTSGAPTAASLRVNLFSGHVIDTNKIVSTNGNAALFGNSSILDSGTGSFHAGVFYFSTTSVAAVNMGSAATFVNASDVTNTSPMTFASGDFVLLNFKVPIVGWSSNVQMSNDTDTRVVAAAYSTAAGAALTAATQVNYGTQIYDTHGAVTTGASWKFTAPVTGKYQVNLTKQSNSAVSISLYKNGSLFTNFGDTQTNICTGSSVTVNLNAGDFIDVRPGSTSGNWIASASTNHIEIFRLSGPSVIAATETVAMSAQNTSGLSTVNNTFTTFTGWTLLSDSHASFNASTGIYTIPVSGFYSIAGTIAFNGNTTSNRGMNILKNGSTSIYTTIIPTGSASTNNSVPFAGKFRFLAGDTIAIQIYQLSGGNLSATTAGNYNQLAIVRVGN